MAYAAEVLFSLPESPRTIKSSRDADRVRYALADLMFWHAVPSPNGATDADGR